VVIILMRGPNLNGYRKAHAESNSGKANPDTRPAGEYSALSDVHSDYVSVQVLFPPTHSSASVICVMPMLSALTASSCLSS
jgi:hypothetical protein